MWIGNGRFFEEKTRCRHLTRLGITLHPDFDRRIVGFADFTEQISSKDDGRNQLGNYDAGGSRRQNNRGNGHHMPIYDDSGHGTHVAGILAGSGKMSEGIYAGIAPEAGLLIAKVLDRTGNGTVKGVMEAIDWVMSQRQSLNLRIVNISVGAQPQLHEREEEKLLAGVEAMWDAGLVVVVSAGNYGPEAGSIAVPGSSRKVITVGASEEYSKGMLSAAGVGGRNQRKEWNYSGQGPTESCVVKPDLVAPGTGIVSCNGDYVNRWKKPYISKSGTSMATPVVSGAIACLLSKYPDMTNVEVKLKLRQSCVPDGTGRQGWGMLNMVELLKKQ